MYPQTNTAYQHCTDRKCTRCVGLIPVICVAKRPISTEQPEKPARGLFAPLLNSLNKKNPQTFALPEYIRNYFEGVATAKNGEFTEAVKPKTR